MKKFLITIIMMILVTCITTGVCVKVQDAVAEDQSVLAENQDAVVKDNSAKHKAKPRYLDFQDILIPGEVEKVEGDTFISNSYGRLMVRGRVYSDSAADFFKTSMATDGWAFQNEYRFKSSIKLFFSKPGKISSILITESPFGCRMEIWVTPQKTD